MVAPPSTQGAAVHLSLLRPGEGGRPPVPRGTGAGPSLPGLRSRAVVVPLRFTTTKPQSSPARDTFSSAGLSSSRVCAAKACLLMFSASPATAAMEICCVWWTTKEEALADAAPYLLRPVRLAARRLLGEHVEKLLGGRCCNATQSLDEHQPRYGFLDPLRVV